MGQAGKEQQIKEARMSEKRYIISDASKQVEVEAHVLRYWEDELSLEIPRNEMGHRYYTDKNINLLKNIKYLKEQGFQLKAIKMILPDLQDADDNILDVVLKRKDELNSKVLEEEHLLENSSNAILSAQETPSPSQASSVTPVVHTTSEERIQQFQIILTEIIANAVRQNNQELEQNIEERISNTVLKQVDYLIRTNEEREETRFKKLDETIRAVQKERMELAATNEFSAHEKPAKRKRGLFGKRKK